MSQPSISESLQNLRDIAEMALALHRGIKKTQIDLKQHDIEIPEILKRSLHRLDMDLEDLRFDLEQMTK